MREIVLRCVSQDVISSPSLDAVLQEMALIEADQGIELAAQTALHSKTNGIESDRLSFSLLVEEGSGVNLGWSIWHQFEDSRPSVVLFQQLPSIPPVYRTCLENGCPMEIRVESILKDKTLLSQAVSWYLREGTAIQELLWLPAEESQNILSHAEWKIREAAEAAKSTNE